MLVRLALPVMIAAHAAHCWAQAFPNKAVRVLTAEPGGGLDFSARVISTPLSPVLGTPVVVTNHGAGSFAAEIVAKAPPDGYSVLYLKARIAAAAAR